MIEIFSGSIMAVKPIPNANTSPISNSTPLVNFPFTIAIIARTNAASRSGREIKMNNGAHNNAINAAQTAKRVPVCAGESGTFAARGRLVFSEFWIIARGIGGGLLALRIGGVFAGNFRPGL
jgi:hypothetical protein